MCLSLSTTPPTQMERVISSRLVSQWRYLHRPFASVGNICDVQEVVPMWTVRGCSNKMPRPSHSGLVPQLTQLRPIRTAAGRCRRFLCLHRLMGSFGGSDNGLLWQAATENCLRMFGLENTHFPPRLTLQKQQSDPAAFLHRTVGS